MKVTVAIAILLISLRAAATEDQVWYEGSLVLRTNEVLRGRISIEPAHDLILFRSGDQLMVYPAGRISAFYFYDAQANINRKFVSLRQNVNAFSADHLYEVVLYGDIKILRRVASRHADPEDHGDGYHYYVQSGERVVPFSRFRSEIYPGLQRASDTLDAYIRENKLQAGNPAHIILIVAYYNKALAARSALARY